jgi:hypothetical protein
MEIDLPKEKWERIVELLLYPPCPQCGLEYGNDTDNSEEKLTAEAKALGKKLKKILEKMEANA